MKFKITSCILALVMILSSSIFVFAASSAVEAEWYTGNGGSVNGKHNGVYHSLDAGTAALYAKNVTGATTTDPVNAKLYRSKTGLDKSYGIVKFTTSNGTKSFPDSVTKSSKYYLVIGGGTHDKTHTFVGTLKNVN